MATTKYKVVTAAYEFIMGEDVERKVNSVQDELGDGWVLFNISITRSARGEILYTIWRTV